jgi:hypothetical protein
MPMIYRDHKREMTILGERERRKREAQEKGEQERADRADEKLKAQVRADLKAKAEASAAEEAKLASMTPKQLADHYHQQSTQIPKLMPPKPTGYVLALEAIRIEDEAREAKEREERERDAGLPKLWAKYDARVQEINDTRDSAIREAGERCRLTEQAARDKGQHELEQLGERPTLDALEVAI